MRLRELVLHNVGVYAGRQQLDLSTTDDRPVVLVGGLNGCGKTTLLDSLQLCLYGPRARCAGRGNASYDEYLRGLISRKARPEDGASVELTFAVRHEGEDHEYRVVRAWSQSGKSMREFVSVFIDGRISPSASDGWADLVEDLLPLELSGLFLFDGEKVKDLANDTSATAVIRTAVNSLLGAGAIEQLRTDLVALRRRQSPPDEDAELANQIASLVGQLTELEHERDTLVQRRAAITSEFEAAQQQVSKAEAEFAAGGGELHAQRSELEAARKDIVASLGRTSAALIELAEGAAPLAILREVHPRLDGLAQASTRASESALLQSVLEERDAWVTDLLPADARTDLAERLRDDRTRRAFESTYNGPNIEPLVASRIIAVQPAATQDRKTSEALVAEYREQLVELAEVDLTLVRVPAEDALTKLTSAVDSSRSAATRILGKLEVTDQDLEDAAIRRGELESCLATAEAQRREGLAEGDYVRRILEHIERVRDTLSDLRARQIQRHIHQVEVAALDSFRKLMRKQGLITDLSIDPESFQMTLRGGDGQTIPTSTLSAGENQILAISLLWGLARVANRPMATVVDTPLGRLDSSNRRLLVDRYFPHAGEQVLLLSTDEEIDQDLHARLSPRIARSYLLEHDDSDHTTQIQDGYWWSEGVA